MAEVNYMDIKTPPAELIQAATDNLRVDAHTLVWKSKGLFHQTCAPWVAACYHHGDASSEYVPLIGHRLHDGQIYALGRCPVCGKMLWAETSRNY